jgi:hypothetical protein
MIDTSNELLMPLHMKVFGRSKILFNSGICAAGGYILKLFVKNFILLDQGHVFFTFTSMEAEFVSRDLP